ncbi:Tyrosine recombinase XerD [Roseivivax jejudonensis]|uniref:Tyrosine recombinase XerD n=1 Tax=Roseivivax jejudonensis TaxID=1529041 RepID=A0A1X6Y810_9RHOB|nr:tyrosine-type recombinase/integrase [Roseivivax jejudonensis]SLN11657.1 Tyrosine recombinase XerD [Roseivivax jejudonensis]
MSLEWREAFEALEGAYATSTMRGYYSDVEAYVAWCETARCTPFPASAAQVSAFLEAEAEGKAPSTVRRRLYGIRKAHRLLGLDDPTRDETVNLAFRRVRRARPSRPEQARGLTSAHLRRFLAVQPDSPWGLRNAAMLSLGYELMTRRSELVALRDSDLEFRDDGTFRVLIRRSKADQEGRGRIAFTSSDTARCVLDWMDWRGDCTNWLFCPIYKGHAIDRSLSDSTVKTVIKTAAKSAGYPPGEVRAFSGHSLRVGAAQDLLRRGFDTAAIMRAGGWKSVSVLARYLELAEQNVWET